MLSPEKDFPSITLCNESRLIKKITCPNLALSENAVPVSTEHVYGYHPSSGVKALLSYASVKTLHRNYLYPVAAAGLERVL
ncbi:hypothetical protein AVEN_186173-1 [Araneus ventricosus]|uniref:Uncharacterized protein n=1 Tax=Araneus ventricosus TaxID=182803 RepID=A0A4Y2GDH3_ARAVE|nr:hypothetical protein AVEN_186173-1 [Araneus ventricosus]